MRYNTAVSRQNEFKNFWDAVGGSLRESQRDSHERKERRANGGCLGYPEARKDVVSCDKLRVTANRY